jgi:hypothetical protein
MLPFNHIHDSIQPSHATIQHSRATIQPGLWIRIRIRIRIGSGFTVFWQTYPKTCWNTGT